jgi:hypothetical protein
MEPMLNNGPIGKELRSIASCLTASDREVVSLAEERHWKLKPHLVSYVFLAFRMLCLYNVTVFKINSLELQF